MSAYNIEATEPVGVPGAPTTTAESWSVVPSPQAPLPAMIFKRFEVVNPEPPTVNVVAALIVSTKECDGKGPSTVIAPASVRYSASKSEPTAPSHQQTLNVANALAARLPNVIDVDVPAKVDGPTTVPAVSLAVPQAVSKNRNRFALPRADPATVSSLTAFIATKKTCDAVGPPTFKVPISVPYAAASEVLVPMPSAQHTLNVPTPKASMPL
jgi:hypothetical protein